MAFLLMSFLLLLLLEVGCNAFVAFRPILAKSPRQFKPSASRVEEEEPQISASMSKTNKMLVDAAKDVLTVAFAGRPIPYFYALETIARVPYFAYVSCLHLYETLGFYRRKDMILLHFSESWNENHHLLIMEELGGSERFSDRWIAQHLAFFYYWIVIALYLTAPAVAYNFNHHIEEHAAQSYLNYLTTNKAALEAQPAPAVAVEYYLGNSFKLESFQMPSIDGLRKGFKEPAAVRIPASKMTTVYDVFVEIQKDESEHSEMMLLLSQDKTIRCWSKNECDV